MPSVTPPTSREEHIERLRHDARFHRERRDLYQAKMYSTRPTSPVRMRELEREAMQSQERLDAALRG